MTVTYTPTDAKRVSSQEFDDGDPPQATKINPLGEAAFDTATYASNRVSEQWIESFDDQGYGTTPTTIRGTTTSSSFGAGSVDLGTYITTAEDTLLIWVTFVFDCSSTDPAAQVEYRLAYRTQGEFQVVTEIAQSRIRFVTATGSLFSATMCALVAPGAGTFTIQIQHLVIGGTQARIFDPISPVVQVIRSHS